MKSLILKLEVSYPPGAGGGGCVRAWLILSKTSSLLWVMVQIFDDVPNDSYYKISLYCSFPLPLLIFILFYDRAVDLTRSQCTVSDTQVQM